jgi:hypothetical protein
MHWVLSTPGFTVMGPNCTVYDSPPVPESMGVTSPSTAASGRTLPLLEPLPPLPPLLLAPLLLAPLLLPPLPPPLLDPLPPLDDPDEPQAEMTTAHASAAMGRREERM